MCSPSLIRWNIAVICCDCDTWWFFVLSHACPVNPRHFTHRKKRGTYEAWKDADAMEAQLKQEKEQEAAQVRGTDPEVSSFTCQCSIVKRAVPERERERRERYWERERERYIYIYIYNVYIFWYNYIICLYIYYIYIYTERERDKDIDIGG